MHLCLAICNHDFEFACARQRNECNFAYVKEFFFYFSSPGPGIFAFSTGNPKVVSLWFPMYIIGNVLGDKANKLFPTA